MGGCHGSRMREIPILYYPIMGRTSLDLRYSPQNHESAYSWETRSLKVLCVPCTLYIVSPHTVPGTAAATAPNAHLSLVRSVPTGLEDAANPESVSRIRPAGNDNFFSYLLSHPRRRDFKVAIPCMIVIVTLPCKRDSPLMWTVSS